MSKFIDLTGKIFKKLIVVKYLGSSKHGGALWLCKCQCGALRKCASGELRSGRSNSCGSRKCCVRFKDLVGKIFGLLTVISYYPKSGQRCHWKCKCECGNFAVIYANSLISGATKSCGCLAGANSESTAWNRLYLTHIRTESTKGKLSRTLFKQLSVKNCVYCGSVPKLWNTHLKKNGLKKKKDKYKIASDYTVARSWIKKNGVDRVNNKLKYSSSNSVSCCTDCNMEKSGRDFHEWLDRQSRIKNDPLYPTKIIKKLKKMGIKIPPKNCRAF